MSDDRDAVLAQRAEQPLRRARHADHARALDVDQRHAVDAGDALDRRAATRGSAQMSVPAFSGANVLLDPDRDPPAHRRRHRLRDG